ncbi:hypothetical protein RRU01S_27_00130 [Agrobacterium rubi TR3 = NBRC 13261]|uniref:Uncharacterized protein n=1 Tax=Agrobacterium rubi TR3 = NBRC 13261 TaxID=1368415 RepID=A0A081D129_9HYPH|nr:hypothetical protein RRU01S_27_00130 [Agrobacterium rubi TR3 = NBRC 13261]
MPTTSSSQNSSPTTSDPVEDWSVLDYIYADEDPILGGHGALPPVEARTREREDELKSLHGKDIEALGIQPADKLEENSSSNDHAAWSPISSGSFDINDASVFPTSTEAEDIKALADYASKLDANALEGGKQEDGDESPLTLKAESKGERKYEGHLPSGKSTTENKASLEAKAEYKLFEKKWAVHEQKDTEGFYQNHLRVFGAETKAVGSAGRFIEDGKAVQGAKVEASASASMLDWKNKFKGGTALPQEMNVDVTAVKAGAKVSGEATFNRQEGEATLKGELGAEAIILEITADGKTSIVPARWLDAACNHTWLGHWKWSQELCRAVEDDTYDYGITLGGTAGVSTGAAAKFEGGLEKKNGTWKFGGKSKVAVGAGGTLGGTIEGGKIGR